MVFIRIFVIFIRLGRSHVVQGVGGEVYRVARIHLADPTQVKRVIRGHPSGGEQRRSFDFAVSQLMLAAGHFHHPVARQVGDDLQAIGVADC